MSAPWLERGLVVATAWLSLWGLFASGADPHRTRVLVEGMGQHDPHGPWGLQTEEACLQLRPWHDGYRKARGALRQLTRARRAAVRRW